jgi:hypothetical protein
VRNDTFAPCGDALVRQNLWVEVQSRMDGRAMDPIAPAIAFRPFLARGEETSAQHQTGDTSGAYISRFVNERAIGGQRKG